MSEHTPSPEFERALADVLRVPDPPAEYARSLRSIWLAGLPRRNAPSGAQARLHWALAVIILLAVAGCTFVVITVNQRRYIPDVGLVENVETLRILGLPALVTREGVTLTVDSVTADSEKTLVIFTATGLPAGVAHWRGVFPGNGGGTYILLPDGNRIDSQVGGMSGEIFQSESEYGFIEQNQFPALPAGVERFTLVVPQLAAMPPGEGPLDWWIPVSLGSGKAYTTQAPDVMPVVPQATVDSQEGTSVIPEWVVETEEGYIFAGEFRRDQNDFSWMDENKAYLVDADGKTIPLAPAYYTSDMMGRSWTGISYPFRMETYTKAFRFPVRLFIPEFVTMVVNPDLHFAGSFRINFGEDPKLEDSWNLDQTLQVKGHSIRLVSARLGQCSEGQCLQIIQKVGPEIESVEITDLVDTSGANTVNYQAQEGNARSDVIYPAGWSAGEHEFAVRALYVKVYGPWSVVFDLEEKK